MSTPAAAHTGLFKSLAEVYQDLYENRQFNAIYFLMMVMACLIALLGLLVNSPAVIIGAMLISPLMGPILSCGLAMTLADWELGRKALRNLSLSVAETIAIAALAAWLSPLKEATPEILARSNPNLMDLLIAFFSGVAGTLALTARKGGLTIIPGVAIATAVMPPLATVGFGLSTGQWDIARGAFMLFATNVMAIVISADLVFLLIGFRLRHERQEHFAVRYRAVWAWMILLVLSIPLLQTLSAAVQQVRLRREVASALRERLEADGRSKLSSWEVTRTPSGVRVDAYLRTSQPVSAAEVKLAEEALVSRLGGTVHLNVQQVRVLSEAEVQDGRTSGALRPFAAQAPQPSEAETLADVQRRVQGSLAGLLRGMAVEGVTVRSLQRDSEGRLTLELSARELTPTDLGAWGVAATALATQLQAPIRLRAAVELAEDPAGIISFQEAVPAAADLRAARRWMRDWQAPNIRTLLVASPDTDSRLLVRRVETLRRALPGDLDEGVTLAPGDRDQMRLRLVQQIDVSGEPGAATAAMSALPAQN